MSIEKLKREYKGVGGWAGDLKSFEVVEEGDWVSEHKYEFCQIIVKEIGTDNYFAIDLSRSGSYFTDYYYDDPEFSRVKRVEETKVVVSYVPIK